MLVFSGWGTRRAMRCWMEAVEGVRETERGGDLVEGELLVVGTGLRMSCWWWGGGLIDYIEGGWLEGYCCDRRHVWIGREFGVAACLENAWKVPNQQEHSSKRACILNRPIAHPVGWSAPRIPVIRRERVCTHLVRLVPAAHSSPDETPLFCWLFFIVVGRGLLVLPCLCPQTLS